MQVGPPPHVVARRGAHGNEDLSAAKLDRQLVRRVWDFARPYRPRLALFLATITAGAGLALLPPLVFARIIDDAIPNHDRALVTWLGLLTVGLALLSTALDGVALTGLLGAFAGAFAFALLHASVALAVGAATGRRAEAVAAAATLATAGYVVQGLLGLSDALRPLRFLTPWHWYLGRNMLVHGVAPDALVVPTVLSLVVLAAGAAVFDRRDLR